MTEDRTGALVGPYRLGRVLGRGGMAVVHEATHETHGRTVALKLLSGDLASDPAFVERFRREGRAQAALDHPHVVTVYEAGASDHGLYLAMQLVPGATLAALRDRGVLTVDLTLRLHEEVAAALDAAHAAGLVHRDVKPTNVLVGPGDHAYLADFGLTKIGDTAGPTVTGSLLGTIAYLAPEVIRGEPATAASDRYAFAAMLYECLSGTPVFPRATHAALLYAHTNEPPPRISARRPELPAELDEVFVAALSKAPAQRPTTAATLVAEVRRILGEHGALGLGPPDPPRRDGAGADVTDPGAAVDGERRPARGRGRRPPTTVVAALLGVILGGGTVAALSGDDPRPDPASVAALPGARLLGSDLAGPGERRDCRGRAPTGTSPACTILQDRLSDTTLVVPRAGVVRRWGVRSARGEFALSVLRRRDTGSFQTGRSRSEFVNDGAPHLFATDLPVEAGDRLALVVVGGSAVGLRPSAAGRTATWSPPLRGDVRPSAPGPAGELLLRVDYVPGGEQRLPRQVSGAAAERLADGDVVLRRVIRMDNGVTVRLEVVRIGDRYALDLRRGGRRVARMDVPGLVGEGRFVDFTAVADDDREQFSVSMEWMGLESERVISHYMEGNASELFFYD
ncbi:serine/threonine-protein kinase [Paraconexibacter sp.]|uniref:serine/threonine-protein kinase n=1 Tax=Paraconexibacter sp. TaxID=2949640 RepID=UPI0035643A6A